MMEIIAREKAFDLAKALNERAWGFVSLRLSGIGEGDEISSVIWHPRQGVGIYEDQIRHAMALAQLHNLSVHINVSNGSPEIRFTTKAG